MRGRGLLISLAITVVLLRTFSSFKQSSEKRDEKQSPATQAPEAPASKAAPSGVSATMPADSKVQLKPGQRLKLTIRSESADVATISELGLKIPVGPDVPGELVLIAPSNGSYAVTLQIAQRTVGTIAVRG